MSDQEQAGAQAGEVIANDEKSKPHVPANKSDVIRSVFSSLENDAIEGEASKRDSIIREYLTNIISSYKISHDYNILILHDQSSMARSDADRIYAAITEFNNNKNLLLVIYSSGGSPGSAYLIGKLCREYCNGKLIAVIPRQAKSAATLLACAADEIHMGSLSELGPIDPQIDGLPALGLKNSIEHIAELVKANPTSSEMFARYLNFSLQPIHLGYYERVAESAMHYAERLLNTHSGGLGQSADKIAKQLVYGYKDHGFVIDKGEAVAIFGENVIKTKTEAYNLGNAIYQEMKFLSMMAEVMDHTFYYIGSLSSPPVFRRNKEI